MLMIKIQFNLIIILLNLAAKILANNLFNIKSDDKWLKLIQIDIKSNVYWNVSYRTYGFPQQIKEINLRKRFDDCERTNWFKYDISYQILVSKLKPISINLNFVLKCTNVFISLPIIKIFAVFSLKRWIVNLRCSINFIR